MSTPFFVLSKQCQQFQKLLAYNVSACPSLTFYIVDGGGFRRGQRCQRTSWTRCTYHLAGILSPQTQYDWHSARHQVRARRRGLAAPRGKVLASMHILDLQISNQKVTTKNDCMAGQFTTKPWGLYCMRVCTVAAALPAVCISRMVVSCLHGLGGREYARARNQRLNAIGSTVYKYDTGWHMPTS